MAEPAADPTRGALLGAAHDLLAQEGPGALTVRRIAAAAGMSTMNVYSRFGGKDGVLDRLFIDGFAQLGAAMDAVAVTADPVADIVACGDAYRDFGRRAPTYYSLMFDRVVPEFQPSPAALAAALATLNHLVGRVQRAMDLGALATGDAFAVAAGLWAHVHGVVSLEAHTAATEDPTGPVHELDWAGVGADSTRAFVRGLTIAADARS